MDFAHPHFAEPRWLWLALLGPVLVLLAHRLADRARRKQLARFAAADLLGSLLTSHSPLRRAVKVVLLALAVAAFGLALARPQWGQTSETTTTLGEDILFVLDCSRSMLAQDAKPTRLERSRLAILDFVQRHGRGRVGLVAFAGQAFLQCPLTFDYDAFRDALLMVDERTIPVPGTHIGRALEEAFSAMEQTERRKLLVLVTDGEDLEKGGVAVARELAQKNVVVFTVGVGSSAGTPIQYADEQGRPQVVTDSRGNVVLSRLDEATLREIAAVTQGSYQPLGPFGEGMLRIHNAVETSLLRPQFSQQRKMGVDRFHWFIGALLALLVVESLLGTRRWGLPGPARQTGRAARTDAPPVSAV